MKRLVAGQDRLDQNLINAIYKNNINVIRENKDVINETDILGGTLLMIAAAKGRLEIIKEMIALGANINIQDMSGYTALMEAVDENKLSAVKLLVELGANINLKDNMDQTALDKAKKYNYKEIIEFLNGGVK